jgi:hypothetical protein
MKKIYLVFIVVMAVIMSSCSYNVYVPEEAPPIDSTKVFSLATDVQPIFDGKCVSCHGDTKGLHLEAENAYDNIVPNNVNLEIPEESLIYEYPSPSGLHSGPKYTAEEAQIVLQWIKQGALNN